MNANYQIFFSFKLLLIFSVILLNSNPAFSDINGRTNRTLKTSTSGCSCHSSRDASVSVLLSGPSTVTTGQTYTFSVNINKSGRTGAGVDISTRRGTLGVVSTSLHLSGVELTHNNNLPMTAGQITLQFSYTAPSTAATDTIFATGLATNSDGNETTGDSWNWAASFKVVVKPPPVILNLSAIIEGFYDASLNTMITDTAKIFLRSGVFPYSIVDTAKAVLNSATGTGNFSFSNATNAVPYYIVIIHRNSLETWSATTQSFTSNSLTYSFTTAATKAFGSNMTQVDLSPVRFAIYAGDVNQDGIIDASDVSLVDNDASFGVSGYVLTDVTGDDYVDAGDLSFVDNNASNSVTVATP